MCIHVHLPSELKRYVMKENLANFPPDDAAPQKRMKYGRKGVSRPLPDFRALHSYT